MASSSVDPVSGNGADGGPVLSPAIVHEVRTSLAAILGYAEMMYDARQTVTERLNCIGRIRQNAMSLASLVEDLQDLHLIEAGALDLNPSSFRLVPELSEVFALLQSLAWKKRLKLEVRFEGDLPETVMTDRKRLRQILLQVIGNAIKFTERGYIRVTVTPGPGVDEAHPSLLYLIVEDTGRGIGRDEQPLLFAPPDRLSRTVVQKGEKGGVGLALARHLARIMGGDIELTSTQPGRGSIFTITLRPELEGSRAMEQPCEVSEASPWPPSGPRAASLRSLRGLRVLIVEDARDIQVIVGHFLKKSGATVDLAEDGNEGLKKAKAGNYDLILMDLQMPVMNGLEVVARLRDSGVRSRVVALTADTTAGARERCLDAGCDGYLAKPIHAASLLELLEQHVHGAKAS